MLTEWLLLFTRLMGMGYRKFPQPLELEIVKKMFEFQIGWCEARCIWLLFTCGYSMALQLRVGTWDGSTIGNKFFVSFDAAQRRRDDIISRILCFIPLFSFQRFSIVLACECSEGATAHNSPAYAFAQKTNYIPSAFHVEAGTWMSWLGSIVLRSAFYRGVHRVCDR